MRNPDCAPKRYTSLAWAAVLGHEETFEFLLTAGHDDEELSKVCSRRPIPNCVLIITTQQDSENNTILTLLADHKPPATNPYTLRPDSVDIMGAALRMARLYYDRYSWILDWSNVHGKTALHVAALKGNEELVRVRQAHSRLIRVELLTNAGSPQMLCDLGADYDLSDNKGNTPLH
jgi:ankyrin repeat protein